MTSVRAVGFTTALVALGYLACGGTVFKGPVGTLDDSGVFHLPDGGILFSPGSACATFDADTLAKPPAESCDGSPDFPACIPWSRKVLPQYQFGLACAKSCGAGEVGLAGPAFGNRDDPAGTSFYIVDDTIRCKPGKEGDRYCSAFFQQFVQGDGKAIATCEKNCDPPRPGMEDGCDCYHFANCGSRVGYVCRAALAISHPCGSEPGVAYPAICVERGGVRHPEQFCQKPP